LRPDAVAGQNGDMEAVVGKHAGLVGWMAYGTGIDAPLGCWLRGSFRGSKAGCRPTGCRFREERMTSSNSRSLAAGIAVVLGLAASPGWRRCPDASANSTRCFARRSTM